MLKVSDLHLPLEFTPQDLRRGVAGRLKLPETALGDVILCKKSLDARKKDKLHFVCAAEVQVDVPEASLVDKLKDAKIIQVQPYVYPYPQGKRLNQRPVVIGFGPAGIFAALLLARCGQKPLVLERGDCVEEREQRVEAFWNTGVLSPRSNVQFGEGGAGTFSDGKLTTGTGDGRMRMVLEELVAAGAPPEILYEAKPHIGTDRLPQTVRALREEILRLGGEVRFGVQVEDFLVKEGKLQGLRLTTFSPDTGKFIPSQIECDKAILAIGHSARDTFEALHRLGVAMEAKAFSVGARIEHPAKLIDKAQYGSFAGHPNLGTADYKLSRQLESGRGVYTFCMCPGGTVTGAASEEGGVVTNGMSTYKRDGKNSNSALLVGVTPADFPSAHPLAGVEYQRKIEQAAFRAAGGRYGAPAQRVGDFMAKRPTKSFTSCKPSYLPEAVPGTMESCLPEEITQSMRTALPLLCRMLRGFDWPDAVLTAPETRSSSPVRILRGENCQSLSVQGLYPCGEGAGYAGGILSAAVDGLRCGEQLLAE